MTAAHAPVKKSPGTYNSPGPDLIGEKALITEWLWN